jgi:Zn finger protein HypA/HybF involved in hydrogenase expression
MTKITCDKCKKEFKFKPRIEKKNGIERVYIKCPKCKTEYTAYYTDSTIRAKQARMRVLRGNYNQEKEQSKG